jgi:hypothetical protein
MDCWLKDLLKYMSWHNFQLKYTLPALWSYQQLVKLLMEEFLTYNYFQRC